MNTLFSRIFKKTPNVSQALKEQTNNPYLNAKRAWNSHVAGLMSSLQIWQFVGLLSLLICFTAVSGVIYIGSQSKFVPLVFQEDRTGNVISLTKASRIPEAKIDDYRTAALRFIENIRLVTTDSELQLRAINQTFSYISGKDPAAKKATEYLNANDKVNPFKRAASETVHVEIVSVLQQTKETWQVEWKETGNFQNSCRLKQNRFALLGA